jgi:TctA family transporter
MAKKGEAAKGLTAAFIVSATGGVIGALILLLALPVLQPLVLMFASPERFMLVMLGIVMISFLSGEQPVKGLLAGALGFLLGTVGQDPQLGFLRFTFGHEYLLGGFSLVPLVMGLFALPEVITLAVRGQIAEETSVDMGSGFMPGVREVFRYFGLMIKSSVIGVIGGAIPGIGGTASAFYAYGFAVRAAKDNEAFGKGDIRGVIAPESANNASAGGELIPTLAFGVPGGATTAVLLSAFLILGITPGPAMLNEHLWLSFSMVFILVISNLMATSVCLCITKWAARLAWVRGSLLIPIILLFVLFGAYVRIPHPATLLVTLSFGVLGYLMMRGRWARVPLLLGFILGPLAENFLFISTASYGIAFMLRPIPLFLVVVTLAVVFFGLRGARKK